MANAAQRGRENDMFQELEMSEEVNASHFDARGPAPLFSPDEAQSFKNRWTNIQTGFVDEPRRAVEDADSLVAELMQRLAETFSNERAALERQWSRGDNVSTEDLRIALQRYRSFFDRLLSI